MSKVRVYDLAKELDIPSKELVEMLNAFDIPAKNHMSALTDQQVKYFKNHKDDKKKVATAPVEGNQVKKIEEKIIPINNQNSNTSKSSSDVHVAKQNTTMTSNQNKSTSTNQTKPATATKPATTTATKPATTTATKKEFKKPDLKNKNAKKPRVTPIKIDNSKKEKKSKGDYKKRRSEEAKAGEIILLPSQIAIGDLASKIDISATEIIKLLMNAGILATINQDIDFETAAIIAQELELNVELEDVEEEVSGILEEYDEADAEEDLITRPPVITVMGHVDHGKTSLLDAIRKTHVTSREAGGITQHIGAYTVKLKDQSITFIDTPGHEAFTAMRYRGASITDIAVLVVAADDGVMPQTIEAINHAKAAGVPIIVAINKIDKANANTERVMQGLSEHNVVPEAWGGDTICVPVSAHTREGLDTLLEMIILASEMLELRANPNRLAKGNVVEAQLDKGRGAVATLLINNGTLKIGDNIVSGTTYGKVRAMNNDKGKKVKLAGPSAPIEILGLSEVPEAGDDFYVVKDEKTARQVADKRKNYLKDQQVKKTAPLTLDDLYSQIKEGTVKDINIVIKADGQGSVEALKQSLLRLTNDEVRVTVIHDGVGAISESDVMLAATSNGIIIGFNVRPGANVVKTAEKEKVDIRLYRVIYDAINDMEAAMKGMLDPVYKEVVKGTAEVRQIFKVPNLGTIGGCYVLEGKIARNNEVRVIRDGVVVTEGAITSLKRFKDDAKDVAQGYECGIGVDKFNDLKEGDLIEAFAMEEIPR